jgi:glutamate N-acetyltransferase/amino-acid N-acetyltransferase
MQGLAKSIAWDGEGATCLVEVEVTGAASDADARVVAKSVAGSSLAKSAIFGHDPNWGRIAAAAGYSGISAVVLFVVVSCLLFVFCAGCVLIFRLF